jgi:hypothetical protein
MDEPLEAPAVDEPPSPYLSNCDPGDETEELVIAWDAQQAA